AEISKRTSQRLSLDELMQRMRRVVADAHRELPSVVVLLNPGTLPKTSSGKLQRSACRTQLEAGTLEPIAVFRAGGAAVHRAPAIGDASFAARVTKMWNEVLGASQAGLDDDFFASGGNSVRALQLMAAIGDALAASVELTALYRAPTLRALIA